MIICIQIAYNLSKFVIPLIHFHKRTAIRKTPIGVFYLPNLQGCFEETSLLAANRLHRHGVDFFRLIFFAGCWSSVTTVIAHRSYVLSARGLAHLPLVTHSDAE
jgi:hypothetical protein